MKYGKLDKDKNVIVISQKEATPLKNELLKEDFFGEILVSTTFLGVSHPHGLTTPTWFETMVFTDGGQDEDPHYTKRYSTAAEALKGHEEICKEVLGKIKLTKEENCHDNARRSSDDSSGNSNPSRLGIPDSYLSL